MSRSIQLGSLLNNNLIDFNQLELVVKPESIISFWDDLHFLYERDFMNVACPYYSPSSSSLSTTESSTWFEPLKPHTCTFCSRAFARRHDLQRHTRVHTGVKPYGCPSCQKCFARSDARRRHFLSDPLCSNHIQVQKTNQGRRHKH